MSTPDISSVKQLPKEAWIGIIAVGAGIVWWSKRNGGDSSVDSTTNAINGDGGNVVDTGGVAGVGVGGSGMWTNVSPTVPDTPPKVVIGTNTEWRMAATSWLVGNNYDPALSDEAITRYLNGLTLSPSQGVMVSVAIRAVGPTPEDLPPGPAVPIVPGVNNPSNAGTTPVSTTTPNIAKPATPSGVRLASNTSSSFSVAWNPSPGASSYIVDTHNGVAHPTSGTSFTATDFRHKQKYKITVRAVNSAGTSGDSSAVTFTSK